MVFTAGACGVISPPLSPQVYSLTFDFFLDLCVSLALSFVEAMMIFLSVSPAAMTALRGRAFAGDTTKRDECC